jgi:hypothetical protein
MKHLKFIFFAVLILGLQGMTFGQALKAEITSVDAYCKGIDALTKKAKRPDLIFADTSDNTDQNSKPKWRKFPSEKSLEKFREKSETYSIAFNWRRDGKIVASNFTNFSGSGDWAMYIYHCYRVNGKLARVRSELRTFYGDYIVTQTRYFNTRQKQISKTVKYQDLTSHKPKEASHENDRYFTNDDIFKTTAKLPFADLITKK